MNAFWTKLNYIREARVDPRDAGRKREAEGWQVDGIAELPNKQLCQYLAFPPESVVLVSGPGKSPASPIHPHRALWANRSSKNTRNIPSWTGLQFPSPKSDRDVRKLRVTPSLTPPWLVFKCAGDPKVWEKKPCAAAHSCGICRVCGTLAAPNVYFLGLAEPLLSESGLYPRLWAADGASNWSKNSRDSREWRASSQLFQFSDSLETRSVTVYTHTRAQCKSTPRRNFTHESRRVIQMSSRPESGVASRSGTSEKGCLGL